MKNPKLNWVRLPLETVENCRELGGYPTENGEQTNWHAFLRSGNLSNINEEETKFLLDYGVTTVIDLRRQDEIDQHPYPLTDVDDIRYHNIPFPITRVSDIIKSEGATDFTMGDFYIKLLEQKQVIKDIFHAIYDAESGCVLFHCHIGKDRTGVIAMLLLGLAGVEKKDILTNYEVSLTNLESIHALLKKPNFPVQYLLSDKEYITKAYDYVQETYGTIENYLLACQIDGAIIQDVRSRMIANQEALLD